MAVPDVDDEAAPRETPPPLDCSAPAPHADALLSVSSFCASPDSDELHRQPDSGAVSPGEVSGRAEAALKTSSPDSLFKTSAAVSRESVASLARPPDSSDPRNALFDDHVASTYVPGSLHLAPDSTIERLVERQGVIPLLRQLAEDLAHRDRELVRVRRRAEERERALKKMLVEVEVSNADIEKRLAAATLQRRPSRDTMRSGDESYTESIDDLMNQAMNEADTFSVFDDGESMRDSDSIMDDMVTPKATLLRRTLSDRDVDTDSLMSNSSRQDSTRRGWKAFFWGQKRDGDETIKGRSTSNTSGTVKRKSIQKDMFAPPEGVIRRRGSRSSLISSGTQSMQQTTARAAPPSFIHTQNQPKAKAVEIAPKEAKSSASMADWSLRRVTQTADEQENQAPESPRPRTQSTSDVDRRRCSASATDLARNPRPNAKAIARRSRAPSISSSANAPTKSSKFFQDIRDTAERIVPLGSSQPAGSTSPGPVEMERIIPHAVQPPTLLQTWNQYYPTDYLTDRFGFIYDKRQRSMSIKSTTSLAGHYQERDLSRPAIIDDDQPGTPLTPEGALGPLRTTPTRREERPPSSGFSSPTTPTAHKPPPGIMARLSGPGPSLTSPASATNALSEAPLALRSPMGINSGSSTAEESTVRLLLGQLSDLHDSLQRDRSIKWNEFLRKIRHERRKGDEDSSKDTPEAALNDGELIGIATVGTEGRGGKQRWKEFKLLVLGGIPVSYRWKVWAECSGATAMRIPGYYDDLLQNGTDDPLVISQIAMDINRTLTDNIFFRKGPGVSKLKQVLLAYSRRNPEVGYCQGMNMITASLLLIMPSEEDAFWVLCSIVERILPKTYFETNLLASRADQQVLKFYVRQILPTLDAHLQALGVELEALTFQWFLSIFTDCLAAEALFRVWDVVLCVSGSTFLFQVAVALLRLNEKPLLACDSAAAVYSYLNGGMTHQGISIDGLIRESDRLKELIRKRDVEIRRELAVKLELGEGVESPAMEDPLEEPPKSDDTRLDSASSDETAAPIEGAKDDNIKEESAEDKGEEGVKGEGTSAKGSMKEEKKEEEGDAAPVDTPKKLEEARAPTAPASILQEEDETEAELEEEKQANQVTVAPVAAAEAPELVSIEPTELTEPAELTDSATPTAPISPSSASAIKFSTEPASPPPPPAEPAPATTNTTTSTTATTTTT